MSDFTLTLLLRYIVVISVLIVCLMLFLVMNFYVSFVHANKEYIFYNLYELNIYVGQPEHSMHKNRLQEFTHKSNIQLPIYQTFNEGSPHMPKFRSTVLVNGASYTSSDTFSTRKAAEQNAAELALKAISKETKVDEGFPLIQQVGLFQL